LNEVSPLNAHVGIIIKECDDFSRHGQSPCPFGRCGNDAIPPRGGIYVSVGFEPIGIRRSLCFVSR
jgi:hypothetical protein